MDDLPILHQMAHPQYDPESSPPYFDHLLLILNGTSSKQVLRLNSINEVPTDGEDLTLMGWGYTVPQEKGKGITPDILQEVSTTYVPNKVCKEAAVEYYDTEYNETKIFSYQPWIYHDMMCGLEKAEGACSDDSGGPVILRGESPDQDVQVGIVSWSAGIPDSNVTCVSDIFPGVYSRVSTHYKWVAAQVCRFSVDPPEYFKCHSK
jgi:secreted trypsin-like serine protease